MTQMIATIHPVGPQVDSPDEGLSQLCQWYMISGAFRYESRGDYLPWICEFYTRDGRQLAHGTGKNAWAALDRAEIVLRKAMRDA